MMLCLWINCRIAVPFNDLNLPLPLQRNMLQHLMMIRFNCCWERFARCPNSKPNFSSIYWTSSDDLLRSSSSFLTTTSSLSKASKPSLMLSGSSSKL
ncbi:hypothetical protein WN943_024986 [Citrus x changshan-huyou]